MNQGRYVFSQLVDLLPKRVFDNFVTQYDGDKYVKHFTCWNQLLVMMFGQLTNRDSLRDLIITVEAHSSKNYHLGFSKKVTRSNLSKANEKRDCRIFEDFAYYLIDVARRKRNNIDFEINGNVYAFDSTTIDLCLSVFWWAKFRKHKAGIKINTLFDIKTQIPSYLNICNAAKHDVNAMDNIPYEAGAYYIFDRAYLDFTRLNRITQLESYFVIRSKKNIKFTVTFSNNVNCDSSIQADQVGFLFGSITSSEYPHKIRKIIYFDKEKKAFYSYFTNNFDLPPEQIAMLYKNRWQIELFFKWMKQHLKIKSFWGETENAVKVQIYTAIITYCLVAIAAHDLNIDRSLYEILQIIGVSVFDKTQIIELFGKTDIIQCENQKYNQLKLDFF
ncbi:MAG: IS4 family transposase [Bacteroidales bacterium]|jgi:hypothetical protein|nr:IS4 family transposase [Bacteroidales bacterium]